MALAASLTTVPAHSHVPDVAQISQKLGVQSSSDKPNSPPVASVDHVDLVNASTAFNVLGNDYDANDDALTITAAYAKYGAVAFTPDGLVAYAAHETEPRSDEIVYILSDAKGAVTTGKVIISAKHVTVK